MHIKFKKSQYIIGNQVEFMNFMRTRAQLIHLSNVFFRDLHYAVMEFLKKKNVKLGQTEAEQVAREVALHFEKEKHLQKIEYADMDAELYRLRNQKSSLIKLMENKLWLKY